MADHYANLEELAKGHPALALFRWFANVTRERRLRKTEQEKRSITAAAIHAFDQSMAIDQIVPSPKVALPWLVKLNGDHCEKFGKLFRV